MTAISGYFLCVLALTPALSLGVFFGVIGRSERQHDLLELFRFAVQMAAGITSPFKLGMLMAIMIGVFLAGAQRSARLGVLLFVVGTAGLTTVMQVVLVAPTSGFDALAALLPSAAVTCLSLSKGWRLLASTVVML
jgi:hypothetical protein